MATPLIEEWQSETANRYESHYISRDFIMCVAMIKCIMATIHSVVLCVATDYIVKYRKIVSSFSHNLFCSVFFFLFCISVAFSFSHSLGSSCVECCSARE